MFKSKENEHEKDESVKSNRLSHLFNRFKQSDEAEKYDDEIDVNTIKNKYSDSPVFDVLGDSYDSREKTDKMTFILSKMNEIGVKSESALGALVPDVGRVPSRIKKSDEEEGASNKSGGGLGMLAGFGMAGLGAFAGLKLLDDGDLTDDLIPSFITNMLERQGEEEADAEAVEDGSMSEEQAGANERARQLEGEIDPGDENPFGLEGEDISFLESLKTGAESVVGMLNKVVQWFSVGMIPSLPVLFFNSVKDTSIVDFFQSKLKAYSSYLYEIMTKVTGKVWEWVKAKTEFFAPIVDTAVMMYEVGTSIKDKVVGWFKDPINKKEKHSSGADPVKEKSGTILGQLAEVFGMGYAGVKESDLSGKRRNWSFKGDGPEGAVNDNKPDGDAPAVDSDGNIIGDVDYSNIETGDIYTNSSKRLIKSEVVYKAFRKAGFSHNQALVLTSHIGRENDFRAKFVFGRHGDPARGTNMGFMSWQGGREIGLRKMAKKAGVLQGKWWIVPSQTGIDVQAQYVMEEMAGKENYRKGVKKFLATPNITFAEAAPLLGGSGTYVGWARGQESIRDANNNWKKWDWRAQEANQLRHYKKIKAKTEKGGVVPTSSTSTPGTSSVDKKYDAEAGTYVRKALPSQQAQKKLARTSRPVIAATWATRHALPRSIGYCARYVADGLEVAKYKFRRHGSAFQYQGATMSKMGFTQISTATPLQVGDVLVVNRNSSHIHGHIQIYNGKQWVSDFKQRTWRPYARNMPPVALWRDSEYLNGATPASGWSNGLNGSSSAGPSAMAMSAVAEQTDEAGDAVENVKEATAKATSLTTAGVGEWNPGQALTNIIGGLQAFAEVGGAVSVAQSAWDTLIDKDNDGDMASE